MIINNQSATQFFTILFSCLLVGSVGAIETKPPEEQNQYLRKKNMKVSSTGNRNLASLLDPKTVKVKTSDASRIKTDCLTVDGPQPVVLLTQGISGSDVIWQITTKLTGRKELLAEELPGIDHPSEKKFFQKVSEEGDLSGNWMMKYLCEGQRRFQGQPGIVGFKWKPLHNTFFEAPSMGALRQISQSSEPKIKVIRSRRNTLDCLISMQKNGNGRQIPPHCEEGDTQCIELHRERNSHLHLEIDSLLRNLDYWRDLEEEVDEILDKMEVPHVDVKYEKLFSPDEKEMLSEWNKIFNFLGVGPTLGDGLTVDAIHSATNMKATFNPNHREAISNYEMVRKELAGTKFEGQLHE